MWRILLVSTSCLGVFTLFFCLGAEAQNAASATIMGRVTDATGAVLVGVSVSARNLDTGIQQATRTTSDGLYRFATLEPGNYLIMIEAQGFAAAESGRIQLDVGAERDVNFKLALAGLSTRVNVSAADAPLVESTKTEVSTVVNETEIQRLPTTSGSGALGGMNDYAGLALTVPGVRIDTTGNTGDLIGPGAVNSRGNLYNVDGGNISDQVNTGRDVQGASIDEVQEFQVLTNNYNAEYGQAGGIIMNVLTKSGTNSLHGDFHFYARGKNLSASNFFYNQGLAEQPNPGVGCSTPPCPIDGQPRAHFFKHETGFTLGGPFKKDRTFWFVSYEKLLQGKPLTLTPPTGTVTLTQPDDEVMWSAKIDHQLTATNRVSLRFNEQRITEGNRLDSTPQSSSPNALVALVVHDHTLNGSLVSVVTPSLVNEARVFWHRLFVDLTPASKAAALAGPNFYENASFNVPQGADQSRIEGIENLTWVHGSHAIKAGISMNYFPFIQTFQAFRYGEWSFSGPFPFSAPGNGVNPPTSLTFAVGAGQAVSKDNIYGWYIQDTWKLRPNITLNYGLRWEYEAGAFRGGTIPAAGGGCFQANGIVPVCSSDKNNFQPRIGIAWSPGFQSRPLHWLFGDPGKSLVSAGFGEVTELAFLNLAQNSLTFDGVTLLTQSVDLTANGCNVSPTNCPDPNLKALLAAFPALPSATALAPFTSSSGSFGTVFPISNHLRNPEDRHVNLTIHRELGRSTVLSLGYVGAFGFGEFGEFDGNYPTINPDPAHPGFFYLGPRPDPRFERIGTQQSDRTSSYHGLIVGLNQRLAHHVLFNGGYAFSKALTSAEDFYVSEPGDPRNPGAEKALAYNDARHAVNFGFVFDSEKLTEAPGIRHLFNDWQVGVKGILHSANPYPVSTGLAPFSGAFYSGLGNDSQQRPNALANGVLSGLNLASNTGSSVLISQSGFAACQASGQPQCPAQTTWLAPAGASPLGPVDTFTGVPVDFQFLNGNLSRGEGRTDPYYRFDVSLTRTFPIKEKFRVELRADFFNVFNHANFTQFLANDNLSVLPVQTPTLPGGGLNSNFINCTLCLDPFTGFYRGTSGQVLTLSDLKHGNVSSTALVNTGKGPFGSLGDPAATDIPRQIQLSIHVKW